MASKCKCKCKLLSLGTINKKFILIIIQVIEYFCSTLNKQNTKFFSETNEHPILYCINYSLGLCLSFISLLIYKRHNKKKIQNIAIVQNNLTSFIGHNKQKVVSNIEKFLLISFVAGIGYLSRAIFALFG